MKKVRFNSMPVNRPKYYFTVENESLNNVYALVHGLMFVNKHDGRVDCSIALNNPNLVALVNESGITSFPAVTLSNTGDIPVVNMTPSEEKVAYWQSSDRDNEFEYRTKKYPMIDPERLAVPDIYYNEYMIILRHFLDIFDIVLEHPLAILTESKDVKFINSRRMQSIAWEILAKNNIKSGPFTLIEEGFAHSSAEKVPMEWGRVVWLPSPEVLLSDEKTLLGFVSLFSHPHCSCYAVKSTDYTALGVSAYRQNGSVVWDMRPSSAHENENMHSRVLTSMILPDNKNVFAPNMDVSEEDKPYVTRELAYAVSKYNQDLRVDISQGRGRRRIERPIAPPEFIWN